MQTIKILILLPSTDGANFFPFLKGSNDVLFPFLKEKELKRSKQTCRLIACACGSAYTESPLTLRERYFAARGSLEASIVWRLQLVDKVS